MFKNSRNQRWKPTSLKLNGIKVVWNILDQFEIALIEEDEIIIEILKL